MSYSIVFSSRTGNTKQLAEKIQQTLPQEGCVYFGYPGAQALQADRLYVGFWTDKGTCDEDTAAFLKTVEHKEVFLFGTAGFGGAPAYFEKILASVQTNLGEGCTVVGTFMCQGKMPVSVRERYEKMLNGPAPAVNLKAMIENFDQALSHPSEQDLKALAMKVFELK